jgi:hypothetical protein
MHLNQIEDWNYWEIHYREENSNKLIASSSLLFGHPKIIASLKVIYE